MSFQSTAWVAEYSNSKGSARLLLVMIANHAHADGTGAFPSLETLAHETRLSVRQICRIILTLEASGELAVERGASPQGTNLYSLPLQGGSDIMSPRKVKSKRKGGDISSPEMSDAGVTFGTDISGPKMSDELSVRTTSFEQSLNHQEHDDAGASSTGAAAPDGATRTEPPVTRAPSQRSQAVKALVDQFALAAHIAAPKLADGAKAYSQRTVFEWFVPLGEIYDRCGKDEPWALAVVQDAVAALDSKGLTISTPRSILKTAVHLVRGGRNGSAPGGVPDDGRTLVPIDVAVRRFKERLRHGDDSGNHEPV